MIVDDHPIVREGLKMVIENTDDLEVTATASNGKDALEQLDKMEKLPDLVVVDLLMPTMDGGSLIDQLSNKTNIFILSTEINVKIAQEVIKKGIRGYLLKDESPLKIVESIQKILDDPNYIAMSPEILTTVMEKENQEIELTDQQVSLLKMIAAGDTNADIARKLFVTTRTVKNYLTVIYETLGVHNRAQAIAVAAKKNLI
ncbi:response regulator transcription factor [Limosilactobacillus sp. STM2_1]|uniref:Response regulator transcription factor n=2 Tax=Limosilactobacillus rudii TaxID=2759755 RepID=A0A7W3UL60_9LACO|nr:response regulator transcription factor [Limosilactobacillus rudii]MBB1097612.1 response regulator transcription factor [Limosilactobacillus rudii]